MLRGERAIPQRLISHLFVNLPPAAAEAAINRVVETAIPGPGHWYLAHASRALRAVADALKTGTEIPDVCECMVRMPGERCDIGQALFRVSRAYLDRRAA